MNYLLQNATGNKTSWYEDVTSYLYLSNLPVALVRTIPLACSENFSLWLGPGEDPDEQWWEKGVLGEAVKVAKDCLEQVIDGCIWVVSGQFLVDIGTAIWEWGCGASKAVGEKLSDIKTVVVAALNVVLNFLIEKVNYLYESLILPLLSGAQNYLGGILDAFQNYVNESSWLRDENYQNASQSERNLHTHMVEDAQISLLSAMLGGSDLPFKAMDGIDFIIDIVEPFSSLVDPQALISLALSSAPASIQEKCKDIMNYEDIIEDGIGSATYTIANSIFGDNGGTSLLDVLGIGGNITVPVNFMYLSNSAQNIWNETSGNDTLIGKIWDNLTDPLPDPPNVGDDVIDNGEMTFTDFFIGLVMAIAVILMNFGIHKLLGDSLEKQMYKKTGTEELDFEKSNIYRTLYIVNSVLPMISLVLSIFIEIEEHKANAKNETNPWGWAKVIPTVLGVFGQIFFNGFFILAKKESPDGLLSEDVKFLISANVGLCVIDVVNVGFLKNWFW